MGKRRRLTTGSSVIYSIELMTMKCPSEVLCPVQLSCSLCHSFMPIEFNKGVRRSYVSWRAFPASLLAHTGAILEMGFAIKRSKVDASNRKPGDLESHPPTQNLIFSCLSSIETITRTVQINQFYNYCFQ